MRKLASLLPDIPRWVETRAMLLSEHCEVSGVSGSNFVARNTLTGLVSVVGHPSREVLELLMNRPFEDMLAQQENMAYVCGILPFLHAEEAILHTRSAEIDAIAGDIRLVSFEELRKAQLPETLRKELMLASKISPIAAFFCEEKPVSFCYAGAETETLWDISIDTLESFRGRGYAMACVNFMIRFMAEKGKAPVWGAEGNNRASLKLAAKLGFQPIDRLFVLRA